MVGVSGKSWCWTVGVYSAAGDNVWSGLSLQTWGRSVVVHGAVIRIVET